MINNTASGNIQHGIFIGTPSNNNKVISNTASSNSDCGIYMDSSSGNDLNSNNV
ncbi:MAG: hypothetical protein K8R11_11305 [Methanococcoides sp.]|nr:hypothetical protein [Methanococcoides sp.]